MAVKHYYCSKVCFNCIMAVQNIKTYFNQSHKLLAIHKFLQHKFGHTVSETSLELQQFCLLLLRCKTYYILVVLTSRQVVCRSCTDGLSFFNWPSPASFPLILPFQTNIKIFTANICENCPYRIWCWYSNPQPSKHKSPRITTRPGLPHLSDQKFQFKGFFCWLGHLKMSFFYPTSHE